MPQPSSPALDPVAQEALALLALGTPKDVLRRLNDGDPLQLGRRAAQRARARCLLLDPGVALLRVQALVASRAAYYRGRPSLDSWLEAAVDGALDQLSSEADGGGFDAELGLAPGALGRFHRLPLAVRLVFCRAVLDGVELEELARERSVSVSEVGRMVRRASDALVPPQCADRAGEVRP